MAAGFCSVEAVVVVVEAAGWADCAGAAVVAVAVASTGLPSAVFTASLSSSLIAFLKFLYD